jgi:hypothetical protein
MATTAFGVSNVTAAARSEVIDNGEIAAIWESLRVRVIQLAGGDEKKVNHNLTIDEVVSKLGSVQQVDKKDAEHFGAFKDVLNKTLQCIQTVGGIVSDGASKVSILLIQADSPAADVAEGIRSLRHVL